MESGEWLACGDDGLVACLERRWTCDDGLVACLVPNGQKSLNGSFFVRKFMKVSAGSDFLPCYLPKMGDLD